MRNARFLWQVAIATLMLCATWSFAQTSSSETQSPEVTSPPARLPEVTVTAEPLLKEELPLGDNNQPEWTARRRFATTRVYVQPPWQVEAEVGWRATYPRTGTARHRLQEEIEIGLPHRFQLDFENADTAVDGRWAHSFNAVELRYALADWGKIPLNPTVGAEWKINNAEADAYELKLQLGEELAPRWHWAVNLFYEQQIGDDRETDYAISQAISYTVIDEKFSVGVEMKFDDNTVKPDRHSHLVFLIGPSVQWRPTPRTHLDIVPLFGTTGPSPLVQTFVFFGIDFGPGSERKEGITPASLRGY